MTIPWKSDIGGTVRMPVYGLGTWGIGGRFERDDSDDAASIAAIRTALERGVRHIDTAEMYGAGHAEELVGAAIRDWPRAELFLASKVLAHHLRPPSLAQAAEASLHRLGTDYLDLYMIHHPSDEVSLEETIAALDELVDRGITRAIGVSNFHPRRFEQARRLARHPLNLNQVHYSLAVRAAELSGLLASGALICAWQPLDREEQSPEHSPIVREIARRYGKTPRQIALHWLMRQGSVTVVCKTMQVAHLEENLGALGWEMDDADAERLRVSYSPQVQQSPIYPLR